MQTLKDIEELIYLMINSPMKGQEADLNVSVDPDASYQSLTERIREMIRHDRGYSIVNMSDSGGIPSPIRESDSFKKLIEFKESEATSEFNSRKVKKIEFSDTMTKENAHKGKSKKNDKEKGEMHFTHSSIDKMIFSDTEEIDNHINSGLGEINDGSYAETVKRSDSKNHIESNYKDTPPKDDVPVEQSFENPAYLYQEDKKDSLRSSIDKKFFEIMNRQGFDILDLDLPSVNNSLAEYPASKPSNRQMCENSDIKHPENTKKRKNTEEKNERKATKKEFEREQEIEELDQDEIDRNSTLKKVELKDVRPKVHEYKEKHIYEDFDIKNKYQSIQEDNRIHFDSKKSGEGKTVNCSVLSRSKSGDAKVQSSSKNDRESINTGPGGDLYYGKSKESNGSRQVLIEEIEIPLDEQNEDKVNENKKTEKNIHSLNKKKVISGTQNRKVTQETYNPKPKNEKVYQRNNSLEKAKEELEKNIKSERKSFEPNLNQESIDKKRKQSDLIIKKGKVFNIGSGNNSKSVSPHKAGNPGEESQSSVNVSFSKNKRDLFQAKGEKCYDYKPKPKKTNRTEIRLDNDDYTNFLKHQELTDGEKEPTKPSSVSFKKKSRNDVLREGSSKRHKTPTHIDTDQADMRILLSQDPKLRNQDRQNSRNDFTVYTSNTGGPSLQSDAFASDMINQLKVKDYVQMNKNPVTISSMPNKKTLERLAAEDIGNKFMGDLNDFNFYTPNNQNLGKNQSSKMYVASKHPLSGSAGYTRGLENDPAL